MLRLRPATNIAAGTPRSGDLLDPLYGPAGSNGRGTGANPGAPGHSRITGRHWIDDLGDIMALFRPDELAVVQKDCLLMA